MGKQTKRQEAKKAKEPAVDAPTPATLCCLPHCEEPGEKLECGHLLCGMDFLKLSRFVSQLKKFTISCPMCRKWILLHEKQVTDAMDHLPFKSAVFKCGCVEKGCTRTFTGTLKACKSHGEYSCGVCGSSLTVQSCNDSESEDLEAEPTPPQTHRQPPFGRLPDFLHTEAWGMTDSQFEQVMTIYKASVGGMSAANERTYRMSRDCHGIPLDFANDIDNIRRHGADYAPRTHMFKFCDAYLQVTIGTTSIFSRASTGQSVR